MIKGMNHVTLAVTDIERSFDFYHNLIGLKPLVKWHRGAYFLLEDGFWFCLNVDQNRIAAPCYTHYAFSVAADDFDATSERIVEAGVHVFKENTSPGESLYFLDPDGHKLEIHASNWRDRVAAKKADLGPWRDVQWFIREGEL